MEEREREESGGLAKEDLWDIMFVFKFMWGVWSMGVTTCHIYEDIPPKLTK